MGRRRKKTRKQSQSSARHQNQHLARKTAALTRLRNIELPVRRVSIKALKDTAPSAFFSGRPRPRTAPSPYRYLVKDKERRQAPKKMAFWRPTEKDLPEYAKICARRKNRREVLFALNRTSGKSSKIYNEKSFIRCK